MGRKSENVTKTFVDGSGLSKDVTVKLFPWEDLDGVMEIKEKFSLQYSLILDFKTTVDNKLLLMNKK